jgi:sugar/nucleoside kinase (ribokinase family)
MLDSLDPTIGSVAVVLLDCTDPRLTEAAIASCRRHSVPVVIDTGSYKKSSEELLVGLEYIIAPQKFFRARNRDLTLDKAMEKAFYDFSPKLLAATGGERGGVYLDESGMHSWEPFPIAVEDSCGAGDTFHGAFAWAVAADAPTAVSFDIAAWVAAKKCAALGNVGLPSRPALDKFLRNSRLG